MNKTAEMLSTLRQLLQMFQREDFMEYELCLEELWVEFVTYSPSKDFFFMIMQRSWLLREKAWKELLELNPSQILLESIMFTFKSLEKEAQMELKKRYPESYYARNQFHRGLPHPLIPSTW